MPPFSAADVSVVIPCYNPGLLLYRAVASVMRQQAPVREIIVIDDHSHSDCAYRVQAYFPGIRVIRLDRNCGVAAARNRGAQEASGRFLAFLDADDAWHPEKIAKQVAAVRNTGAAVSLTGFRDLRASVRRWGRRNDSGPLADVLDRGIPLNSSSLLISREAFARVGGYDDGLRRAEDIDLIYRLAASGVEACFCAEPLADYHHDNENSITAGAHHHRRFSALLGSVAASGGDDDSGRRDAVVRAASRHFTVQALAAMRADTLDAGFADDLLAYGDPVATRPLRTARALQPLLGRSAPLLALARLRRRQQRGPVIAQGSAR